MHKDNQLTINTVNCQGLGDCNKRRDIFNYLRKKHFNIYFLQDTHFISDDEKFIQTQWGYKAYFSSFKSNSRGVAVLLNNNCDFCISTELHAIYYCGLHYRGAQIYFGECVWSKLGFSKILLRFIV